jgi:hypothetical protein
MPEETVSFEDALANAAALYERYLATTELTRFSDLASAWLCEPEDSQPVSDGSLLDLTGTTF